jgi:NTE family protein
MLNALYERGIEPDLLVGTSVGAINAAFVASRHQAVETAVDLQRVWQGLSRSQIFPANPITAGLGLLGVRDHSVPVGSLRRLLGAHLEFDQLGDAPIPVHVVAADALSGEEVLLSTGPVVDAVLASAAIPGVFPSVRWEGRVLVDGGIVNNTPISHAVELGADRVIVLPAIGGQRLALAPRGIVAAGLNAIALAISRRFADDLACYADSCELLVLPPPKLAGILPTDFGHTDELISDGLTMARAELTRRGRRAILRPAA